MKKIILSVSIGLAFAAVSGNAVYALNAEKNIAWNEDNGIAYSGNRLAILDSPAFTGDYISNINYVNIRAIRDFQLMFNKVDNAMWFSAPNDGFEAYFVQDGYGDRVIYDKKGRWQFTLMTYGENRLPRDIRSAVKATYFDFRIALVEEVQTIEGVEYIVSLEDRSNILVVKVDKEGEMEVLQNLDK